MAHDINSASDNLVSFLGVIMDPYADQQKRREAYEVCEEFKEHSPLCAQVGLLLSERGKPPVVRHFGLQLIEHCIKFRWNDMRLEEKIFIKDKALELLESGTDPVMTEQAYIKDVLSRIIVEMIKREWPQQWPSLLPELDKICSRGETQTELVLLIFLRLAEDIVIFQNVQNQRRREIHQTLTSSLKDIFPFFLRTLNDQYTQYIRQKQGPEDSYKQQMLTHGRVAEVALTTIAGFVEWVPMSYITAENNLLLKILCGLLSDSLLQTAAADCLLQLVGRKGTLEERKPLLMLFEAEAMSVIFTAASSASNLQLEEQHYFFLKKLCQVLTGLGLQLTALLGNVADVEEPPTFSLYLNSILAFTRHPSHVLSCYTQSLWLNLCQNSHTSTSQSLKEILPEIVEISTEKLIRMGFPSQSNSQSCAFSRFDFDGDEEFLRFYHKFRTEVLEVLKNITALQPEICLRFGAQWLQNLLQEMGKSQQNLQDNTTPSLHLQWEGLEQFFEGINRFFICEKPEPLIEEGMRILETLLGLDTQDPTILSSLLSCISSFFELLAVDARLLPKVLDKVFATVVFSLPGETKSNRSKAVKNVRRHACSFLIRICKQCAPLVLPVFGHIYNHTKSICGDAEQLSHMEKCALYEALILISNEMCDYEKQCNFLGEIIAPVSQAWHSDEIKRAFSSVEAFMAHVGLDRDPPLPGADDAYVANRSLIMYCVLLVTAIIKRTAYPSDVETAEKGGFLYPQEIKMTGCFIRSPASPHVIPFLNGLFSLLRVLDSLYIPEIQARINPAYAGVTDMLESAKNNILGINNQPAEKNFFNKSAVERMQNFVTTLHENVYHALGNAPQHLGLDFYTVPELPSFFGNCAFSALNYIPDHRLRFFNRNFIKNFLQFCPSSHYNLAVAVLEVLCPFMYQKLSPRWEKFKQVYGTSVGYEDEMTESQEILEDRLNRQLTREYIEILGTVLVHKKVENCSPDLQDITELGKLILEKDSLRPTIIMTVFSYIHWLDTNASVRSLFLCPSIVKQLIKNSMIGQELEVVYLLRSVLLGLQELGEHEANQSLLVSTGLFIYESLRPHFPGISETLMEITGCKKKNIQNFDTVLKQHSDGKSIISEKKRREMFKKLVSEIIGKNVGQHFKREIDIKNLPPLFSPPRPKNPSVDEVDNKDLGLCSLFSDKSSDCDARIVTAVSGV